MSNLNWRNIRSHNGSQQNAFEELVCQLANEENISGKKNFIRKGTPDGGVEAYCVLEDGSEYGWQAKYFDAIGSSQWKQIEESFMTAIEKHSNLVKYFVCIPLDRPDARVKKQKSLLDKWNDSVEKWRFYAQEKYGRSVEIEYWGSFELTDRLVKEENIGRIKYFFYTKEFSDEWFERKLEESIKNLGNRYTPEFNVDLEINDDFDGLARNSSYIGRINQHYMDIYRKVLEIQDELQTKSEKKDQDPIFELLRQECSEIIENHITELKSVIYEIEIPFYEMDPINLTSILEICRTLGKYIDNMYNNFNSKASKSRNPEYLLQECRSLVVELNEYLQSDSSKMLNTPIMILSGEAGIGKSHLLADIAQKRMNENKPVLLLLGQHFTSEENPWSQIFRNLSIHGLSEYEFLSILDAKAESQRCKILIMIDAINEGKGKYFWKNYLRGFIDSVKKYKWLSLVLSVRDSYEETILPKEIESNAEAIKIAHRGFAGDTYDAATSFFSHYNLIAPSMPLLNPEFQNPLFLKLFCDSLHRAGERIVPIEYNSLSRVINCYLETVNEKVANLPEFFYPSKVPVVKKAIDTIIAEQLDKDSNYLSLQEARQIVSETVSKDIMNGQNFFDTLLKEGVFQENMFVNSSGNWEEGIYFSYEKVGDYLTASFLLSKYSQDKGKIIKAFQKKGELYKYIETSERCYDNQGLIEALSIQLPEMIEQELWEVAPECSYYDSIIEAFINSLMWRDAQSVHKAAYDYVDNVVLKSRYAAELIKISLQVSAHPNRGFNANWLHGFLFERSLGRRDADWTIFINERFYENYITKRMTDWAWSEEEKNYCSDESIKLLAIAISWFLTSSNRKLRDSSTKALICLLQNRLQILIELLKNFEGINDPYIYERLFAAAYGCVVRTNQEEHLKELSEYVYETIFNKEMVYPHILLRDYARNVIEYTTYLGIDLNIDIAKIRPPYKSEWYKKFLTLEEIEKKWREQGQGQNYILRSMRTGDGQAGYGDFGRYIFQSRVSNWREKINPQTLSNAAVERIFELGYDQKLHGKYDESRGSGRHHGNEIERIGKKYQWIILHEILAKLSDHFEMDDRKYEGPWEPYARDIDPTITMRSIKDEDVNFFEDTYEIPLTQLDEWVHQFETIPDFEKILFVGLNEEKYVLLSSHLQWQIRNEDEEFKDIKELFIKTTGLLVPKRKKTEYAKKKQVHEFSYGNNWSSAYNVFSKEYYWSYAARDEGLIDQSHIDNLKTTTLEYLWENEYDKSKESVIRFLNPSAFIVEVLGLKQNNHGRWEDNTGKVICYDMVLDGYQTALLIEREALMDLLKKHNLALIWDVYLEKKANRELQEWRFVMDITRDKPRILEKYGEDTWSIDY